MESIYNHPDYPELRKKTMFFFTFILVSGLFFGAIFYAVISVNLRGNVLTYPDSDLSVGNDIVANGLTLRVIENVPCKNVRYNQLIINLSSC